MQNSIHKKDEVITLPLSKIMSNILEESRMVLPGIQALFGFQLVAVFNSVFQNHLTHTEHVIHYLATFLVALATGLVLATAAYHRTAEPETISEQFIILSTRFLRLSMVPLMLGICMDFYILGILTVKEKSLSFVLSIVLLCIFIFLWFIFPSSHKLQKKLVVSHE